MGWRDAGLVYTDGPTAEADLAKYLRVDGNPSKAPVYYALIINDQTAPSTARYEYGPTYATDWDALVNSYASSNGSAGTLVNLRRAAVAMNRKDVKVVLGLPWPDTKNSGFRTPTGRVVNLTTAAGRANALTDFVTVAKARFTASGAAAAGMQLWGVYWMREDLAYGDAPLVSSVTGAVRGQGLRPLWVPYFTASQAAQWATLGFDAMSLQGFPGAGYQQTGAAPIGAAKYPNLGQLTRGTTPAPGSWATGEAIGWSGDPARAGVIAGLGQPRSVKTAVLLTAEGGDAGVNWPRHITMLLAGCRIRTTAGAGPLPCPITPLATKGPSGVLSTTLGRTGQWTGSGPADGRYLIVTSTLSTLSMWPATAHHCDRQQRRAVHVRADQPGQHRRRGQQLCRRRLAAA